MKHSAQSNPIKVFLAADIRFVKPDVLNDHVWALDTSTGDPAALSLFTTYGLRSKRMRMFPRFKLDDTSVNDPAFFSVYPSLKYCSTNACNIGFSPFQNVDVQLNLWVPTSQIVVGQMNVFNAGIKSISLGIDWLIQLNPHGHGMPMTPIKIGMNQVLHGETSRLHPVFYLTGGPEESTSEYPGLGITLQMVPDVSKQVTWVLSTLDSIDSSFFYARQYSSKVLEIDLVKNEITDQFQKINFSIFGTGIGEVLSKAQTRAFQLMMPSTGLLRHDTYVQDRNADTGYYFKTDTMDQSREWSGQTTFDTWYLAQLLLPGRPEALKSILQNFFDSQEPDGYIDFRVSVNRRKSGILASPVLISLVNELHQYLNDFKWLSEIYPSLLLFLKKWESKTSIGLTKFEVDWDHPIQTGMFTPDEMDEEELIQFWAERKSGEDILLVSLLFHEAMSLLHISKVLGYTQESDWLNRFMSDLKALADSYFMKLKSTNFKPFESIGYGKILCQFKRNGDHIASRKLTRPARLILKVTPVKRLSPAFVVQISGKDVDGNVILEEGHSKNLILFNKSYVFITNHSYHSLSNVQVSGLDKGDVGLVSPIEPAGMDVFCFMLFWSGMYTLEELSFLEKSQIFLDYIQQDGIHLKNISSNRANARVPNSIATLLIRGLIQSSQFGLASEAYLTHFFHKSPSDTLTDATWGNFEQLPPVRLFLELLGLRKLGKSEILVNHLNPLPWPVTLSYNQLRIITGNEGVEIFTRKGDTIKITEGKPQRILID